MKDIYRLMNDVKTDTEEYSTEVFTEIETRQWEKRIRKRLYRRRRKQYVSIAAGIVFCFTAVLAGVFNKEVRATMNSAANDLQSWFMGGVNRSVSRNTKRL